MKYTQISSFALVVFLNIFIVPVKADQITQVFICQNRFLSSDDVLFTATPISGARISIDAPGIYDVSEGDVNVSLHSGNHLRSSLIEIYRMENLILEDEGRFHRLSTESDVFYEFYFKDEVADIRHTFSITDEGDEMYADLISESNGETTLTIFACAMSDVSTDGSGHLDMSEVSEKLLPDLKTGLLE